MKRTYKWIAGAVFFSLIMSACQTATENSNVIAAGEGEGGDPAEAQHEVKADMPESAKVIFYNVENLYDIYDDPKTEDNEYTPDSVKQWNEEKYNTKLDNLAKVINTIAGEEEVLFIGLAEVENEKVVDDLAGKLNMSDYGIAHEESIDGRGIDVALIYNSKYFNLSEESIIRYEWPFEDKPGRDILVAKGTVGDEDVCVYVNHWSSRWRGEEETRKNRLFQAEQLMNGVTETWNDNSDARIIVMGDFNDEPDNASFTDIVQATTSPDGTGNQQLYNMSAPADAEGRGTYNYKGNWQMIDQVLVSGNMLSAEEGIRVSEPAASVFKEDWMMYHNEKYDDWKPNRTYAGDKYFAGYSDHLPIYFELEF